jgi:hypothetical protein
MNLVRQVKVAEAKRLLEQNGYQVRRARESYEDEQAAQSYREPRKSGLSDHAREVLADVQQMALEEFDSGVDELECLDHVMQEIIADITLTKKEQFKIHDIIARKLDKIIMGA